MWSILIFHCKTETNVHFHGCVLLRSGTSGNIVSDDDFLYASSFQSGLFSASLSELNSGILFRVRFLLMVSLKRSFGLPMFFDALP